MTKLALPKVPKGAFAISAQSRGKELLITMRAASALSDGGPGVMYIVCNMGMTGFFEAAPSAQAMHKHAHLSFHATDGSILSYVDVRRFGTWEGLRAPPWELGGGLIGDRGPDPVKEHEAFRSKVVSAVAARPERFAALPICQVLHDQSLFNGIGNYLRAEILHRAGVAPFMPAAEVLANLPQLPGQQPDLLTLCRDVPSEVIKLKLTKYQGGNPMASSDTSTIGPTGSMAPNGDEDQLAWKRWLRVYGHDDASWAVDKEGRRIWFRGPPGRLYRQFAQKSSLKGKGIGSHGISKKPAAASGAKRKTKGMQTARQASASKSPARKRPASITKGTRKSFLKQRPAAISTRASRSLLKRPAAKSSV